MSIRVLLVDDNVHLLENLEEVLEAEGVIAEGAASGEEALERLGASRFDLVITDMRMPGMNGLEILREIRARWPALPVVVMTAYARDSLLEEVQAAGALGVLPKPLDLPYLVEVVSRIAPPNSKVLLVEDDRDLRMNLSEALWDAAGLVPFPVGDLESARRAVLGADFPVAVIDVRLPDGDGAAFGRELQSGGDRGCRVIYITGFGAEFEETLKKLLDTPNVRLLEKPFPPERLLALVREAV